jgi:hypothetical protein
MVFGNSCKDYGLKSDTLVLHSDGTLDQFTVAQDGRRFEATGQHWKFSLPTRSNWIDAEISSPLSVTKIL